MLDLITMFKEGGPFALLLMPVLFGAPLAALVFMALGLARIRQPAFVWWMPPALLFAVGALGTLLGMQQVMAALVHASLEMKGTLAAAGEAVAWNTWILAQVFGAVMLQGLALAAAISTLNTGPGGRFTPVHGIGAALITAGGGAAVFLIAMFTFGHDSGPGLFVLPALTSWAALCYGIAGIRMAGDAPYDPEDADDDSPHPSDGPRTAGARVVVVSLCIGAVLMGGLAFSNMGMRMAFEAVAHASAEMKTTLLAHGLMVVHGMRTAAWLAVIPTALGGLVLAAPVAAKALDPRGMVGLVGTLGVLTPTAILLFSIGGYSSDLQETGPLSPVWLAAVDQAGKTPDIDHNDGSPGGCAIVYKGGWNVPEQSDYGCPLKSGPATLPLTDVFPISVAIAGDAPASALTDTAWANGPHGWLTLLTKRPLPPGAGSYLEPLSVVGKQLLWAPKPELVEVSSYRQPEQLERVLVVGTAGGVRIVPMGEMAPAPATYADGAAREAALAKFATSTSSWDKEDRVAVVVPGPGWKVQDVVDWCDAVPPSWRGCGIAPGGSAKLVEAVVDEEEEGEEPVEGE